MKTISFIDERLSVKASKKYLDAKANQSGYFWNKNLQKYEHLSKQSVAWYNQNNDFIVHYR